MNAEETVAKFIAAIERLDIDGVLALMASDAEYDNVPMSKAIGHDAIRGVLQMFLSGGADSVRFEVLRQAATGNIVMNERIDHLEMGGKLVKIAVAGIFEIDPSTGLITLWRDYFDVGQLTAQMS